MERGGIGAVGNNRLIKGSFSSTGVPRIRIRRVSQNVVYFIESYRPIPGCLCKTNRALNPNVSKLWIVTL